MRFEPAEICSFEGCVMPDILIIPLCIILGMCCGAWQRGNARMLRGANRVTLFAIFGLLFMLGARLGADTELLAQLPILGGRALCIAIFCTGGSVLALWAVRRFFPVARELSPERQEMQGPSPFMGSFRILACFALGIALGLSPWTPSWMIGGGMISRILYLLVFSVGISLGADLRAFRVVRDFPAGVLAVPLLIVFGTAAGAVASAPLLPGIGVKDSLCVGFGLGYYSLSSVLVENAGNPALASVALLSNIAREVIAILAAPMLAKHFGGLAPVGAAGATAMDTTLPVIARVSGERYAVIAVFSGLVLTLLVPFLVTLVLQ